MVRYQAQSIPALTLGMRYPPWSWRNQQERNKEQAMTQGAERHLSRGEGTPPTERDRRESV